MKTAIEDIDSKDTDGKDTDYNDNEQEGNNCKDNSSKDKADNNCEDPDDEAVAYIKAGYVGKSQQEGRPGGQE